MTKDKKKRDELQDEISLLKAKAELAWSKQVKTIVASPSHTCKSTSIHTHSDV